MTRDRESEVVERVREAVMAGNHAYWEDHKNCCGKGSIIDYITDAVAKALSPQEDKQ